MPEIKTKQRKNQPVMNAVQRQMQRNFVRSKAEQAAHRQSEQSDSPSNYAEEKISRTAEDAVRDGASFAVREIRSLHQRNNDKHGISLEAYMPEEYQKTPAKGLPEAVLQHSKKRGEKQRYKESSSNSRQMQREVSRKAPVLCLTALPKSQFAPVSNL